VFQQAQDFAAERLSLNETLNSKIESSMAVSFEAVDGLTELLWMNESWRSPSSRTRLSLAG
jgi:hypothetical protein